MKRILWILSVVGFLSSCGVVDDYLLGKDNLPRPRDLAPLAHPGLHIQEKWSISLGSPSRMHGYLKLKPRIQNEIIYMANVNGVVQAIKRRDAKILWSQSFKTGFVSGPVLSGDFLVLGTNA